MQTRLLAGQSLALQQVLSPQLQHSLLVLQTPLLELRNLVQQEMETNPVLEELPDEPGPDAQDEAESSVEDNFKDEFEKLASLDEEWRDYMAQSTSSGADGFRSSREAKRAGESSHAPRVHGGNTESTIDHFDRPGLRIHGVRGHRRAEPKYRRECRPR